MASQAEALNLDKQDRPLPSIPIKADASNKRSVGGLIVQARPTEVNLNTPGNETKTSTCTKHYICWRVFVILLFLVIIAVTLSMTLSSLQEDEPDMGEKAGTNIIEDGNEVIFDAAITQETKPVEDQQDLKEKDDKKNLECYTGLGQEYNGKKNTTKSGIKCQRWDSQSPHTHSRGSSADFPESNLQEAGNYCRNPDLEPNGPWCYTTDPDKRWKYCGIPKCP